MRIIKAKDYQDMCQRAAMMIAAQVMLKPECVLGLATGATPLGIYSRLTEWHRAGGLSFAGVTGINLDEYKGLGGEDPQSYRYYMNDRFFGHVDIDRRKTFLPDGTEADSAKACGDYDRIIDGAGGIDLQLLGLGHNGHIGFNEPSDAFPTGTHCVDLTESTIRANQRFFEDYDRVPRQAYTVGIGTIMRARKILVAVSGADKAGIVKKAFFGPVTPKVPGSVLQLHGDVVLVADEGALSLIDGEGLD